MTLHREARVFRNPGVLRLLNLRIVALGREDAVVEGVQARLLVVGYLGILFQLALHESLLVGTKTVKRSRLNMVPAQRVHVDVCLQLCFVPLRCEQLCLQLLDRVLCRLGLWVINLCTYM